ncbi:LSM domain-containing protein [Candidatus Harpocratesius sp.]
MRNPSLHLHFKTLYGKLVKIRIRLYQTFLTGTLESVDQYSNILLSNATEYQKNEETGELIEKETYANLLLRGDSIINLSTT